MRSITQRPDEQFAPDVMPPVSGGELRKGWMYNAYNERVEVACTSCIHHSTGRDDKTTMQRPLALYSTKRKALEAMRNVLEKHYAAALKELDAKIAKEPS